MANQAVGVLGATSLVGDCLLQSNLIDDLGASNFVAFSRESAGPDLEEKNRPNWRCLTDQIPHDLEETIEYWVCLAPIWVLADYFSFLERYGVRRIVVLSSTSLMTKKNASDSKDNDVAGRLALGEKQLVEWAEEHGVGWVILRPTLIYGLGRDKNISSVARFIKRFGFFPLLGRARGLRQPIHAKDVAKACLQALMHPDIKNKTYNLSGGEVLSYKEMIKRIFIALERKPRFLPVSKALIYWGIMPLRLLPMFKYLSVGMAERMNQDLIFDHSTAMQDFGFSPRPFQPTKEDISCH